MSEIFKVKDKQNVVIDFLYIFKENKEKQEIFQVFSPEDKKIPRKTKKGKAYIRYPNWAIMNDISQQSGVMDPFTNKLKIDSYKFNDYKIKRLLYKIEDEEGNITEVNDDFVNKLYPSLANYLLNHIDRIITNEQLEDGMNDDEKKELEWQVFHYFRNTKKRQAGIRGVLQPPTPSVVILKQICEMFHCTPDEARRISRRDLDALQIVSKQEEICQNPDLIGLTPRDHIGGKKSKRATMR